MAASTYTGTVTVVVPADVEIHTTSPYVGGAITLPATSLSLSFTPQNEKSSGSEGTVIFTAEFSATSPISSTIPCDLTFYVQNGQGQNFSMSSLPPSAATLSIGTDTLDPTASATSGPNSSGTTAAATPASGSQTLQTSTGLSTNFTHTSLQSSDVVSTPLQSTTSAVAATAGGHSTRELAGVAVGCVIGGALFVGLLAFLFIRTRKKRSSGELSDASSRFGSNTGAEKPAPDTFRGGWASAVPGPRGWEKHLPQPESDQSVRSTISRTLDQIELHVENFYQDKDHGIRGETIEYALRGLGDRRLLDAFPSSARRSARPTSLIKHCIAASIVSRIDMSSSPSESFLPGSMTALGPLSGTCSTQGKQSPPCTPASANKHLNRAISGSVAMASHYGVLATRYGDRPDLSSRS
jgi:hypothetical protein